jgi:amphi-Trp domain-containing protein
LFRLQTQRQYHDRRNSVTQPRDIERMYAVPDVVAKLRRLADALESGKPFRIQVAGERIHVPSRAEFSVEHERDEETEEIEFQLKWSVEGGESDETEDEEVV